MLAVREGSKPGFYVFPASLVLERAADCLADEHAALPLTDALVELFHESLVEAYVQSHGHSLTHRVLRDPEALPGCHRLGAFKHLTCSGELEPRGYRMP
jgi:hypothetical protein